MTFKFNNRTHHSGGWRGGGEFLSQLIALLRPRRLIAIGNGAAQSARRISSQLKVIELRHPSQSENTRFSVQIGELYALAENGESEIEP